MRYLLDTNICVSVADVNGDGILQLGEMKIGGDIIQFTWTVTSPKYSKDILQYTDRDWRSLKLIIY